MKDLKNSLGPVQNWVRLFWHAGKILNNFGSEPRKDVTFTNQRSSSNLICPEPAR